MQHQLDYELIDFGGGRKLERFGKLRIERVSLEANRVSAASPPWTWKVDARYIGRPGDTTEWEWNIDPVSSWNIEVGPLTLEIRTTPAGQLGFFPEHTQHWPWLESLDLSGRNILNLFAYTGATSLKLASLGANVTHIDSSKAAVTWARANAGVSQSENLPIRWIVEDVRKFLHREIKRGNRYDGFVADPPSYGHGPKGEPWKIEHHLSGMLDDLRQLAGPDPRLALLTSHTASQSSSELVATMESCFSGRLRSGQMRIKTVNGRELRAGWFARIGGNS